MSRPTRVATFVVAIAAASVLAVQPSQAATSYDFGVHLDGDQPDATPWLRSVTGAVFCFVDEDGDGNYGYGDAVALHPGGDCASNVNAIRMATFSGNAPGRFIGRTEPDGRSTHASFGTTTPVLGYVDVDTSATVSVGDWIYLDLREVSLLRIGVGDIRLTATDGGPIGSQVGPGAADLDRSITKIGDISSIIGYADVNGNEEFDGKDTLYLRGGSVTGEAVVEIGDMRFGGSLPAGFGTLVALGDNDAPVTLAAAKGAIVCFTSDQGATYGVDDVVVVRASGSCSTVRVGDQRLSSTTYPGARAKAGDSDIGAALSSVTGRFTYVDQGSGAGFGAGDSLYLDVTDSPANVDAGDIRLTAVGTLRPGLPVKSGDADAGRASALIGSLGDFMGTADADGSGGFNDKDAFYFNADGGGAEAVEVDDVRLTAISDVMFFGSQVTTGSPEPDRTTSTRTFEVCFADSNGSAAYDLGEPAYLSPSACSANVVENAIRLVAVDARQPGTKVRTGEEIGTTLSTPTYDLSYLDADSSSSWSLGDTLYLHLYSGTDPGKVELGDIRLTPFQAKPGGTAVTSTDPDENAALVELASSLSGLVDYWDVDGDGAYDRPDVVYLDPASTASTRPSFGFVRLSVLIAPGAAQGPAPTPTDTTPPTGSPSPTTPGPTTPVQSLTDGKTPGDKKDPSDKSADTPGPALALLLLAGFALLMGARRARTGR